MLLGEWVLAAYLATNLILLFLIMWRGINYD
jgi:hypothetical protein